MAIVTNIGNLYVGYITKVNHICKTFSKKRIEPRMTSKSISIRRNKHKVSIFIKLPKSFSEL